MNFQISVLIFAGKLWVNLVYTTTFTMESCHYPGWPSLSNEHTNIFCQTAAALLTS